jgi:hypothetical protein
MDRVVEHEDLAAFIGGEDGMVGAEIDVAHHHDAERSGRPRGLERRGHVDCRVIPGFNPGTGNDEGTVTTTLRETHSATSARHSKCGSDNLGPGHLFVPGGEDDPAAVPDTVVKCELPDRGPARSNSISASSIRSQWRL